MFEMLTKYVLSNNRLSNYEKEQLAICFDLAYALGIQAVTQDQYPGLRGEAL